MVFWAILIQQCFFVKANVSSRHWTLPPDLSFSLYNSLQWWALPNLCHWNMSSRALQMLEAAASPASSTKQMLVKKTQRNNHFVIYRYHWNTSETLPRSSEDPMCKTVCREELCKLGHCHSFSSLGFHHSNYFFLQILNQLLRDFTGQ